MNPQAYREGFAEGFYKEAAKASMLGSLSNRLKTMAGMQPKPSMFNMNNAINALFLGLTAKGMLTGEESLGSGAGTMGWMLGGSPMLTRYFDAKFPGKGAGQWLGRNILSLPADMIGWSLASKAGDALMPHKFGANKVQQAYGPPPPNMVAPPQINFPVNRGGPFA